MHINNALCCNLVGKILHKNKVKKFQVQQKLWAEILVILFYIIYKKIFWTVHHVRC